MEHSEDNYAQALEGEGAYWDNYVAQRLLRGEIPGSIDWRLTFTQFRYNHDWRPLSLGSVLVNFRLPEINYVIQAATPRPGMRVLDLGCGAGWLSLELARRGAHVTALDISPTNLALGRYMAETNVRNFPYLYQDFAGLACRLEDFGSVEYAYADLNTVHLPRQEYDAVVVWDSLHHVADLERLLEEVRGALKPGGVFVGVDHSYASGRTTLFNQVALPWLDDLSAWLSANDPLWLYEAANNLARERDWGLLAADYDPTPVPGFGEFLGAMLPEMLGIVQKGRREESAPSTLSPGEESPFEDVSALRVMRVLLEGFKAERFATICPWVAPERHIAHYRSEPERISQHYLAAALVSVGEQAIARGQADGQWFLFHLTPDPPTARHPMLDRLASEEAEKPPYVAHLEAEIGRQSIVLEERLSHIALMSREMTQQTVVLDERLAHIRLLEREMVGQSRVLDERLAHIALLEDQMRARSLMLDELASHIALLESEMAQQTAALDERAAYIDQLTGEVERKNAALADNEARLRQVEAALLEARAPRLPWKRRKPGS